MANPQDLDQGGTFRTWSQVYMGPTIGWVTAPSSTTHVTAGGTTTVPPGVSMVHVEFNGAVTIQLPPFKQPLGGQAVTPLAYVPSNPIFIVDTGGFATAHPITILPGAGETIDGLASIQITNNYGAVTLMPDPVEGGAFVTS